MHVFDFYKPIYLLQDTTVLDPKPIKTDRPADLAKDRNRNTKSEQRKKSFSNAELVIWDLLCKTRKDRPGFNQTVRYTSQAMQCNGISRQIHLNISMGLPKWPQYLILHETACCICEQFLQLESFI